MSPPAAPMDPAARLLRARAQRLLAANIKNLEGFTGRIQNVISARTAQTTTYQEQLSQGRCDDITGARACGVGRDQRYSWLTAREV